MLIGSVFHRVQIQGRFLRGRLHSHNLNAISTLEVQMASDCLLSHFGISSSRNFPAQDPVAPPWLAAPITHTHPKGAAANQGGAVGVVLIEKRVSSPIPFKVTAYRDERKQARH